MLNVLENYPTVLKLRVPIKIYGSIHGRFSELLRYFENFGGPATEEGETSSDLEKFDYLFLGNYVDRGFNSLEVLCTLFALKIKYPD